MEEYSKAVKKLKRYNQEQIIKILDIMNGEEKKEILEQINKLDFKKISTLYEELSKKEKTNLEDVEEIKALNKDKLSKEELEKFELKGEDIIKNNKYALVTMSGGQGTRLGYNKPKGTFLVEVNPKPKYLFEILADSLKEANKKYNVTIPWYIMTSEENNDEIVAFFKEHKFFDYPKKYIKFFKQGKLPLITEKGKLIVDNKKKIKEASDGNGGIFRSMYENNILEDMKNKGIKWIFIGSIDNILLKIADPILIGLAEERNVDIATKSLPKNSPEEKIGSICKINNRVKVIEYSEMSEEMKYMKNEDDELKYGESHIMCNLFSLKALKTLARKKLPYHIAHKKSDYLNNEGVVVKPENPNVYKFEQFIFDAWEYFSDIAVLRGKREEDFAPIKNATGVDSPETAVELYNNYMNKMKV